MTTREILQAAKAARPALQGADTQQKNRALLAMADALEAQAEAILAANAQDMDAAREMCIRDRSGSWLWSAAISARS